MKHELFEKKVMEKLLVGTDKYLEQLRNQHVTAEITSREFTGHGFFTKFKIDNGLSPYKFNGRIDDVVAKFVDPLEVEYFILYITDGEIDTLEGFSTLNEWNDNYADANIEYCYTDKREYELN